MLPSSDKNMTFWSIFLCSKLSIINRHYFYNKNKLDFSNMKYEFCLLLCLKLTISGACVRRGTWYLSVSQRKTLLLLMCYLCTTLWHLGKFSNTYSYLVSTISRNKLQDCNWQQYDTNWDLVAKVEYSPKFTIFILTYFSLCIPHKPNV